MAQQLNHTQQAKAKLTDAGNKRPVKAAHLNDGETMNAGNAVTVFSKQVPSDKIYAWGAGTDDRQQGRSAFIYADIQGTDDSGSTVAIEGDVEYVITDSEQRDVEARGVLGDIDTLADAADDPRTERPQMPVTVPIAESDQHIELRVVADSASDGVTLDRSSSSIRVYYTDVKQ